MFTLNKLWSEYRTVLSLIISLFLFALWLDHLYMCIFDCLHFMTIWVSKWQTFFYENAAGAEQILLSFSGFAGVLCEHFRLFYCLYQFILSLHNAMCMSIAICISTMNCCVLSSLPFSKTCEKVFEMFLLKGLNAMYKIYWPKQCRIFLLKTIRGLYWEILICVSRHRCLQCCEDLPSRILSCLASSFNFLRYSDRELKLLLLESQ